MARGRSRQRLERVDQLAPEEQVLRGMRSAEAALEQRFNAAVEERRQAAAQERLLRELLVGLIGERAAAESVRRDQATMPRRRPANPAHTKRPET